MNYRYIHLLQYMTALIFLFFPIQYVFSSHPLPLIIGQWIALISYIASVIYFMEGKQLYRFQMWLLLLLSITYFTQVIDVGCIMFFMFPASMSAYALGVKLKSPYGRAMLGMFLLNIIFAGFHQWQELIDMLPAILFILMMMFSMEFFGQQMKLQRELSLKNEQLALLSAELERTRISQDLHDSLGQVFSTLSVKSELAVKLLDYDKEMTRSELKEINELSRSALYKVREIVEFVDQHTLEDELEQSADLLRSNGINVEISHTDYTLDKLLAREFIMIIRELTNNIIKHSHAHNVSISFEQQEDNVRLEVKDDGIGSTKPVHINSVEARVRKMGGEIHYDYSDGLSVLIKVRK